MQTRLPTILILTTAAPLSAYAAPPEVPPAVITVQRANTPTMADYPATGVELGQGWSSAVGGRTDSICIKFRRASLSAQTKTFFMRSVVDRESLLDRLDVSAEVQFKAIVASVDAKTKFAREVKIDSEYQSFLAHAQVQNGADYTAPIGSDDDDLVGRDLFELNPHTPNVMVLRTRSGGQQVDLDPKFAKLARDEPAEFLRECGDSFVSAIVGGGEVDALLTFHRASKSDQTDISATIEGSGWGFQASGGTTKTLQRYSDSRELTLVYFQSGGAGDAVPTDQAGFLAKIAELPKLAHDAPTRYKLTLQSYTSLPSWPTGVVTQRDGRTRARLAQIYGRLTTVRDELQTMLDHPSDYVLNHGVTIQSLKDSQDKLTLTLRRIEEVAAQCNDNPDTACAIPADVPADDYSFRIHMPVRAGSFPEAVAVATLDASRRSIEDAIAAKKSEFESELGGLFSNGSQLRAALYQALYSPRVAPFQDQLNHINAQLAAAKSQWPAGLRAAIADHWVRKPSTVRCSLSLAQDSGCLTNKQIDELTAQIPVLHY